MKPSPVLVVDQVALEPRARSLSLELFQGDAFAVMGPAGSGRKPFVRTVLGEMKPAIGQVKVQEDPGRPRTKDYGRRATPQGVAKALSKRASGSRLTEVLSALGLWDVRQLPVHSLEPEQQSACDLLSVFVSNPTLGIIDGELDVLDPWVRESALQLIEDARGAGSAFIVGTNLTTIAQRLGSVIVFSGPSPVYAGSVSNLIKNFIPDELVVETHDPSTVASMIEPFSLQIRQTESHVLIHTDKGQEVAARLLTEGYGQVRSLVLTVPTLADALKQLV